LLPRLGACLRRADARGAGRPSRCGFDIARFIADGNTLLPEAEIDRLLRPF
jgi:hypothetical protein